MALTTPAQNPRGLESNNFIKSLLWRNILFAILFFKQLKKCFYKIRYAFKVQIMKYRTKLYLIFLSTGLISSIGGVGVLYQQMRPFIFQDDQIKALAVSGTTAALIDPELVKQIQTPSDIGSIAFQKIQQDLNHVTTVNQRRNIY